MANLVTINPNAKNHWQDWLKTFVLLGMGIYFVVLILSGDLANYINLRFAWLTYLGAAIFWLLGLWSAYRSFIAQSSTVLHGTNHTPLTWGAISVVAIPLILATAIPSQPLTADAISGGVSFEPIGGVSAEASYTIPPLERNVLDWLREFNRAENPATLDGLPVDVIAFVYREPSMTDTQFMAARFTLSCCVADAFAIGMPVEYTNASNLADGIWVRVQGTLEAGEFDGEFMPIVRPNSVEEVETPETPYLYS